jgi:signal peptidase I
MSSRLTDSLAYQIFDIWKDTRHISTVQVSGLSMYPLIEDGDSVVVTHTRQSLKPGDTVAFRQGPRIIVHRVLRSYQLQGDRLYVTRGDNNRHIDPRVREQAVVGRVAAIIRKNRRTIDLDTPLWRFTGRMVVKAIRISRLLPRRLMTHKITRNCGHAILRVLSSLSSRV